MLVSELIAALHGCYPDAEVFVASWQGRYGPLIHVVGSRASVRLDTNDHVDKVLQAANPKVERGE